MKTLCRTLTVVTALGFGGAWVFQQTVDASSPADLKSAAVVAASADPGAISLGGEKYGFGQRVQTVTQQSQMYIRSWETMQNWTQMIAVRLLPYAENPTDYAQAVKESVMLYNPDARAFSESTAMGAEAEVNFQLWDPKNSASPFELHLVRVRRDSGGLVLHEFVYRGLEPGDKGLENFREAIKTHRAAWEKELAQATWPPPLADPTGSARWQQAVREIQWYIHSPHVFVERKLVDVSFSLDHLPKPPDHAWLYIRPVSQLDAAGVPVFLDAIRAFRATGLDLKRQPAITDASLAQILEPHAGWPIEPGWRTLIDGLRYLNLKGTPVTDQAAPILARMTPLQVLILNDAITDEGLRTIAASLTHLARLRPGGPAITDRGAAALKNLTQLHRLDLSDTSITGAGLSALKDLGLIEVDLGPAMGDDALTALSVIPTLVHLECGKSRLTEKGVEILKRFTHLHTLFISSPLDDHGVQTLIQIPSLRRLDVSGSRMTDAGIKTLSALTDLEELALTRTAVTDQGIAALTTMRKLRFLEISDTWVTVAGLAKLSGLPALDVLSFSHQGVLKLGDLKPLGALPNLRTVIINGAPLKREAMEYLRDHAVSRKQTRVLRWVTDAEAASASPLGDNDDVAQLTDTPSSAALNDTGLRRIHDVESDLDHVIPDVATAQINVPEDTAQNFLGDFTVGVPSNKKKLH